MTTTPIQSLAPRPEATKAQILSRYANLTFAPLDRKPDTSMNRQRGARKSPRRRFIL